MTPRSARPRSSRGIALVLAGTCLVFTMGGVALAIASDDVNGITILGPFLLVPFIAIGALILFHRPGDVIGALLGLMAVFSAVGLFSQEYAVFGIETRPGSVPFPAVGAWVGVWIWQLMLACLLYVVLSFPTGRLLSPRWRAASWITASILGAVIAIFAIGPASDPRRPSLVNPYGIATYAGLSRWVNDSFWLYLILLTIAVAAVVTRFRRAADVERQQLKWAAFGFVASGAGMGLGSLGQGVLNGAAWSLGLSAIPLTIGIAILRYRLYEIDVVIERTLVYGLLTALLGAVYVGAVLGTQALLGPLTGGNEIAIAASTLLVVALFQPLRRRIQRVVDRRFYRARYDAQRTIDLFSARMRDSVDLRTLETELLGVVDRTLKPADASIWLRDGSGQVRVVP